MFGFDWSEIALIGVVALVLIGPKDMPVAIRMVTDGVKKLRRMAAEMQGHVDEMVREADLGEARDTFRDLRSMNLRGQVLRTIDGDGMLRKSFAEPPGMDATRLRLGGAPAGTVADATVAPGAETMDAATADPFTLRPSLMRPGGFTTGAPDRPMPESDPSAPAWLPPGARRATAIAPAWVPPGRSRRSVPAWMPVEATPLAPAPAPDDTVDATRDAPVAVARPD